MRNLLITCLILFLACVSGSAQDDPLAMTERNTPKAIPVGKYKPAQPLTYNESFDAHLRQALSFDIPIIGVEKFSFLLEQKQDIIILDARSKQAYEVSHIPNAQYVGSEDGFSIENVWMLPKNKMVVVYGTTGEKSEKIAKKLREMGFSDVRNLYGSIIEWVNQDGQIVNKKEHKTNKVAFLEEEKDYKSFLRKGKVIVISND